MNASRYRKRKISSLGLWIIAVVIFPVGASLIGIVYSDQYRETVFQAEFAALERQGETLAGTIGLADAGYSQLARRRISTETMQQAAQLIASIPDARIRIFQPDGSLMLDSISAVELAAPRSTLRLGERLADDRDDGGIMSWLERLWQAAGAFISGKKDYPPYRESDSEQALDYPAVLSALEGDTARFVRRDDSGHAVLGVAVPIRNLHVVRGALLLTASGERVEADVAAIRFWLFWTLLAVLGVTVLLGLGLSRWITTPISELATAADRIREAGAGRMDLPHLTRRKDEIGVLARNITAMTQELQAKAAATAGFAADVAHEIKNPLTSIRSAVETLQRITDPKRQKQLLAVLVSDVVRLDRLISDISAASRLDRDLSEADYEIVDLADLVSNFVASRAHSPDQVRLDLNKPDAPLPVRIAADRIVQVLDNLLRNAISFSPPDGTVTFTVSRTRDHAEVAVADQGPGVPDAQLEKIFDRFYTERPKSERFGEHSGLGLSISRRIAEAHGGQLVAVNDVAVNDKDARGKVTGARLILTLPLSGGGDVADMA